MSDHRNLFTANKSEDPTPYRILMTRRSKARVTLFNNDTGNTRLLKPFHSQQKRRSITVPNFDDQVLEGEGDAF
jgi:hypothetical protein